MGLSSMELRDYQKGAMNKAYSFIQRNPGEHGYVLAPGGSGKSVMISALASQLAADGKRVVVLARSEKLVAQNYDKSPNLGVCGIYCAGLGQQDASKQVTFATIQSIHNVLLPHNPDFVLVDECDEIHPDPESNTQYWHFMRRNGEPTIIGFTATDYRSKSGKIEWGRKICEIPLKMLIDSGHLCPPVQKQGAAPDVSHVRITAGEFNGQDLGKIYDDPELLDISIKKIIQYMDGRNRGLVFSQSVKHGKILTENLNANGIPSLFIDGDTDKKDLQKILQLHELGAYRILVNCMLATVGYDLPWLDLVAIIRSTNSKRLFEQMIYRGTRLYEGKKDFLLLDMGGNLERHGGLGAPLREKKKGREAISTAPGKICPKCEEYVEFGSMQCPDCGFEFPEPEQTKVSHEYEPSKASPTYEPLPLKLWLTVTRTDYIKSKTKAGDECIIAKHHVSDWRYPTIREWIIPHHAKPFPRQKAHQYFKMLGDDIYGGSDGLKEYSIDVLLARANTRLTRVIEKLHVDDSGEFPNIIGYASKEINPEPVEVLLDDEIPDF